MWLPVESVSSEGWHCRGSSVSASCFQLVVWITLCVQIGHCSPLVLLFVSGGTKSLWVRSTIRGGTEVVHSLVSCCLLHLKPSTFHTVSWVSARSQAKEMSLESGGGKWYIELICFPFWCCGKTLTKSNWGQEKACLAHTFWSQCNVEGSLGRNSSDKWSRNHRGVLFTGLLSGLLGRFFYTVRAVYLRMIPPWEVFSQINYPSGQAPRSLWSKQVLS